MDEVLDLHVYTNNSVCGHDKISFLCETAVEKNIRGLAFTHLCRVDAPEDFDMHRRLRHSFFDICKAKQLFFDSVAVFAGVEFEQAVAAPALVDDILKRMKPAIKVALCTTLSVMFILDLVYTNFNPNEGEGITDYAAGITQQSCNYPPEN